jgi:hypothetical protein
MSWFVRLFESAFVRKIAYMCAAALFAFVASKAHAQTCTLYQADGFSETSGSALCADVSGLRGVTLTFQAADASLSFYPSCSDQYASPPGHYGQDVVNLVPASGTSCPTTSCTATAGHDYNMFVGGGAAAAPGSAMCGADGCGYTAGSSSNARSLVASDGAGHQLILQTGTGTGSTCTPTSGPPSPSAAQPGAQTNTGAANATCASASGNIVCATQSSGGKNCGTYNGDQVCVQDMPAGSCVAYASGGVACSTASPTAAATTPPSPNNGTAGTPATPSETVTTPAGTINYYNTSTVNNSTTATTTGGAGASGTPTGAPASGGSGSGVGPAGATSQDCAFGGTCTDGTLPSTPAVDSVQTATTSYIAAIRSAPIVTAVANIGASIPSGTCPAPQFTIWGRTFTMDAACSIFDTVSSILSAICLIVYTVMSVRVFMSA